MANVESVSFALLIPFAVCFLLIFLVCCFADKIKELCRMPSPLPRNYIAVDSRRSNRHRNRRRESRRAGTDDSADLIRSEEGRSRNISESSVGSQAELRNYQQRLLRTHLPSLMIQGGFILCPQTELPSGQNRPIVSPASLHSVLLPTSTSTTPVTLMAPTEQRGPIVTAGSVSGVSVLGSDNKKSQYLNPACVIIDKESSSHTLRNTVTLISKPDTTPTISSDRR